MKDLLITIYGGGDEAVAAVQRMGDDWRAMLEQAATEIERRWIPVTERLPPDGVLVLAYRNRCDYGFRRDGQWIDTLYGGVLANGPTHWMPLPAPPTDAK